MSTSRNSIATTEAPTFESEPSTSSTSTSYLSEITFSPSHSSSIPVSSEEKSVSSSLKDRTGDQKFADGVLRKSERDFKGPIVEYQKSYKIITQGLIPYLNAFCKNTITNNKHKDLATQAGIELDIQFQKEGQSHIIIEKGTSAYTYFRIIPALQERFEDEPDTVRIDYQFVIDRYLSLIHKSAYNHFTLTNEEIDLLQKLGIQRRAKKANLNATSEESQAETVAISTYLQESINKLFKKEVVIKYLETYVSNDYIKKNRQEFMELIDKVYRFILETSYSLELEKILTTTTTFGNEIVDNQGNSGLSVFDLRSGNLISTMLPIIRKLNTERKTKNINKLMDPLNQIFKFINEANDQSKQATFREKISNLKASLKAVEAKSAKMIDQIAELSDQIQKEQVTFGRERSVSTAKVVTLQSELTNAQQSLFRLQSTMQEQTEIAQEKEEKLSVIINALTHTSEEQKIQLQQLNVTNERLLLTNQQKDSDLIATNNQLTALKNSIAQLTRENANLLEQLEQLQKEKVHHAIIESADRSQSVPSSSSGVQSSSEAEKGMQSASPLITITLDNSEQKAELQNTLIRLHETEQNLKHSKAQNVELQNQINNLSIKRPIRRYIAGTVIAGGTTAASVLGMLGIITFASIPVLGWAVLGGMALVTGVVAAYKGVTNYRANRQMVDYVAPRASLPANLNQDVAVVVDQYPQPQVRNQVDFQAQQNPLCRLGLNQGHNQHYNANLARQPAFVNKKSSKRA